MGQLTCVPLRQVNSAIQQIDSEIWHGQIPRENMHVCVEHMYNFAHGNGFTTATTGAVMKTD
jgi:hypothetical protein